MGDFIARLAERTLGVAPVVQPLMASIFAPGPTGHSLDLEWDSEATTSSGDLGWAPASSTQEETPLARDAPTEQPEDAAMVQQEDRDDVTLAASKHTQSTSDTPSEPHHPAEPASLEVRGMATQKDEGNPFSATPGLPQRTPEEPEPLHPIEPDPTRHDEAVSTSRPALSEDLPFDPRPATGVSDRAISRPIRGHVEQGQGASSVPQPSPSTTEATSNRLVPPDAPSAQETPPTRDTPTGHPEDAAISWREDRNDVAPTAPEHPQETPDTRPGLHHPTRPASMERRVVFTREDQGKLPPATTGPPQRTPDGLEPHQPAKLGPTRHDETVSTSHHALPEDSPSAQTAAKPEPELAISRLIETLVERGRDTNLKLRPSPDAQTLPVEERASSGGMPMGQPEGAAIAQQENRRNLPPAAPGSPREAPEGRLVASYPGEPGSPQRTAMPGEEDQRDLLLATAGHTRTPPRTQTEAPRHPEPGPTRQDDALPAAPHTLSESLPLGPPAAEDGAGRAIPRLVGTLAGHAQSATLPPRPSPDTQASLDASGGTIESEATSDHPAQPEERPAAPGTVRPRINVHVERGPREPRVAAPESSTPTTRVSIGRIEVRSITPPPRTPPERPLAPSDPVLSLDDYLKQRNGGR